MAHFRKSLASGWLPSRHYSIQPGVRFGSILLTKAKIDRSKFFASELVETSFS
jgi:hypothetical protein